MTDSEIETSDSAKKDDFLEKKRNTATGILTPRSEYMYRSEVEESLITSLEVFSDSCTLCQNNIIPVDSVRLHIKYPNTEDRVGGWVEPTVLRNIDRKKKRRKSADDALYIPFNDYANHPTKRDVKRKSADDDWLSNANKPTPFWKSVVEVDTYRYIPNNAKYRAEKSSAKMEPVKMKKPEKTYLTAEQRALQKEIQRDLRREFNSQQQQVENNIKNGPVKLKLTHSDTSTGNKSPEVVFRNTRQLTDIQPSVLQKLMVPTESPVYELPPITGYAGKNYLDPFLENVSKKLSALDEEMRRDYRMQITRKSIDNSSMQVLMRPGRLKDDKKKIEALTQDTFSVKPIGNKAEKRKKESSRTFDLENVTSEADYSYRSHIRYTATNGEIISIPIFSNINAPNTTTLIDRERQYFRERTHMAANSARNSLENTLQTMKCEVPTKTLITSNSRKKKQNNPLHPLEDYSPEVKSYASHSGANGFPGTTVGKHRDKSLKKDFGAEDSYTDLLPKVSGKRLEVLLTTDR